MDDDDWQSDEESKVMSANAAKSHHQHNTNSNWNRDSERTPYGGRGGGGGGSSRGRGGSDGRYQNRREDGGGRNGGGFGENRGRYEDSSNSLVMEINPSKVGAVIGRGGGKIREIQDTFNVNVKVGQYNFSYTFRIKKKKFTIFVQIVTLAKMVCPTLLSVERRRIWNEPNRS